MAQNDSNNHQTPPISTQLIHFLERAILQGVGDIEELSHLVPEERVSRALIRAANHNPLRGRALTVDDIVAQLELQAMEVLERESTEEQE
jgi:hypothetical protein